MNEESKTVNAKYIFIDIVSYTYNRSVEAQTDLVAILNQVVNESVNKYNIPKDQIIYIPTGDGICICLLDYSNLYDIHLLIALDI